MATCSGSSSTSTTSRISGVNAIYLTPIFQSASNHRYHTYDYFKVDPLLGGDAALRELLDRAHERGMRVVLDGVFNHTGRGFWPFHHILEAGAASPYRDWFHLDPDVLAGHRLLTPYPPLDAPTGFSLGYKAWWGLPALPKLNTDHPDVREYLLSVAEHWLRFGIDGWRLDVPTEIDDPAFWAEFRRRCRAIRPDAYLVGEIWEVAPDWVGGDGFDALMNYPLAEAILGFVGGPSLDMGVVHAHHEYRRHLRPLDGPGFAARLDELLGRLRPGRRRGPAQPPRIARRAAGADGAWRRCRGAAHGDAAPVHAARRAVHLLRRRDRPDAAATIPPIARSFPWDPGRWDTALQRYVRSLLRLRGVRAGAAARVDDRARTPPVRRSAFERRLDARTPRRRGERRAERRSLEVTLDGVDRGRLELGGSRWHGARRRRRRRPTRRSRCMAGAARFDVPPRTGRVLRLAD